MEGLLPPLRSPSGGEGASTPRPSPPLATQRAATEGWQSPPLASPRTARNPSRHVEPGSPRKPSVRLRRFFFDQLAYGVKPTLPLYYDVLMPSHRVKDSAHDHLRYRYVDFICPTTTAWHGLLEKLDDGKDAIDVQQLTAFFSLAEPRTRIDAYPMYVLLRDILQRQLNGTLKLRNKEAEALRGENEQLKRGLQESAHRIAELEQQLSASGEELHKAELVRQHKESAEAALERAETTLKELTANKFRLTAFRAKAANLTHKLEECQQEQAAHEQADAEWTFVDLEAMLSEALEHRGPDDQTLERAFLLLGEENCQKLHLRLMRAHQTVFTPKTKYRFIVVNAGKDGQECGQQLANEEDALRMRLREGVASREEEAEVHHRLAHLEEEKLLQHEMEDLQLKLQTRTGSLSAEEEILARERLHQLEGLARDKLRGNVAAKLSAGLTTKEDAEAELLSLDDAETLARDRSKLVAALKSGTLSPEELSRAWVSLESTQCDKRLAALSPAERLPEKGISLDGIERAAEDLVHQAENVRKRLMIPNLTAAQRKTLLVELENVESASEGVFQATMKIGSNEDCELMADRARELERQLDQAGLSDDDRKRREAELEIVRGAADAASTRANHLRTLYKQTVHDILCQARSMKALFGKANRGLVDQGTLEKTLQEKAAILAAVEASVHQGQQLRTVSHAQTTLAQNKAGVLRTGLYSAEELATMDPATVREAMQQYARKREVMAVNAETQTQERCLGIRKVEECLSKYVAWDPDADTKNWEKKHPSEPSGKGHLKSKKSTVPTNGHSVHDKQHPSLRTPSYHSKALTHMEGIMRAKPHSIADIQERVAKLIRAKILQDIKLDESMMKRTCLPDFVPTPYNFRGFRNRDSEFLESVCLAFSLLSENVTIR